MTTFKDAVFQYGGVPVGSGMLPQMGGTGKAFFVDPANGSDNNSGRRPDQALDTVGKGEDLCTDKAGDVVYLLNDGNTTGSSREATIPITWDKDNTHCIGLCAPVVVSQRARITPASGAALTANPVITVSGHGNIFSNLQIGHWGSTDDIAARGVDVTGNRNYFQNCHIIGITHANVGDEATAADVKITGEENVFERCTFGVDTVARSTTNACVELTTQATRTLFKDCIFSIMADNADALFIKADAATDLDRWTIFDNCLFINAVESTGTTMTSAVNVHDSAGGMVILKNCMIVGATDVAAADNGNVFATPIPAAATGALGTVVTQ